jgi:hypothetical protein
MVLTFVKYTTIMIAELVVTSGLGSSFDYFVPLCVFVIILCDILKYNLTR